MNLLALVRNDVSDVLAKLHFPLDCDFSVTFSSDPNHGDIAVNVSMKLASLLKRSPIEIGKEIVEGLLSNCNYISIKLVAPGFINFELNKNLWTKLLFTIHETKEFFGNSNLGKNEVINLEFVSANPTGPMHIGHARGAVVGDIIANLLSKIGYKVIKEYYINDNGSQINKLLESVYIRCIEKITGIDSNAFMPNSGFYSGEYLKDVASSLVVKYDFQALKKEEALSKIRDDVINQVMFIIKEDLSLLGIKHDIFSSEKALNDMDLVNKSIDILGQKGLLYDGVLEEPKGFQSTKDWVVRTQRLFRSTDFGDDRDRAVQKEDKNWTYFAGDIAYHFDKISRGFKKMIVILGIDHAGYSKRLKAVVSALSDKKATIDVVLYGIVKFLDKGTVVKMSKRSGSFLTVRDVIEQVGKDATRFMMVMCGNDQIIEFDFAIVLEHSKNNPIFYVQYAHARIQSLIRGSKECGFNNFEMVDVNLLSSKEEKLLIKTIARWPSVVENAAIKYEPHKIAFYLLELSELFHALWGCGNSNCDMRFIIKNNQELTMARLFLAEAIAYVIRSGLILFGIEPVFEM